MKKIYLKSTGQQVRLSDEAVPAALKKRRIGRVSILIPNPSGIATIATVRTDKLRFVNEERK